MTPIAVTIAIGRGILRLVGRGITWLVGRDILLLVGRDILLLVAWVILRLVSRGILRLVAWIIALIVIIVATMLVLACHGCGNAKPQNAQRNRSAYPGASVPLVGGFGRLQAADGKGADAALPRKRRSKGRRKNTDRHGAGQCGGNDMFESGRNHNGLLDGDRNFPTRLAVPVAGAKMHAGLVTSTSQG